MRLTELDPRWLLKGGQRVGFVFRNPVRGHKGWWVSCFFAPTPEDEQEKLIEEVLGADAIYQQCNPAHGWSIVGDKPTPANFETISITPSLDGGPNMWHGHITNGEIK